MRYDKVELATELIRLKSMLETGVCCAAKVWLSIAEQ